MDYKSMRRIAKILKIFAYIVIVNTAIAVGVMLSGVTSDPVWGLLFALIAIVVGGLIALLIFGMSEFIMLMIENADNIEVMQSNVYLMTSIFERLEEKLLDQNEQTNKTAPHNKVIDSDDI